jgi:hypothetical protein
MCATSYHQEAIYETSEEKYFGSEEFLGKNVHEASVTRGSYGTVDQRRHACPMRTFQRGNQEMTHNSDYSFAIIRFNEKTYMSGGVVAVIKGTESAQRALNDFEWCQSQEDRGSGWRYFLEETDLQPGIDPAKATRLRQLRLDLQESQAKSL